MRGTGLLSSLQDCKRSISLDPHFVKPRLRRALALRSQKKWKESRRDYKAVLEMDHACKEAKDGLECCDSLIQK